MRYYKCNHVDYMDLSHGQAASKQAPLALFAPERAWKRRLVIPALGPFQRVVSLETAPLGGVLLLASEPV